MTCSPRRGARAWLRASALLASALLASTSLGACLGPVGDEHVGYSAELRPSGTAIPSVDRDTLLKNRIANNSAISNDLVTQRSAFANGAQVHYWDFGVALTSLEPIWTFRRHGRNGPDQPIDHYDLIDSIPGDANYSPFRALFVVFVTSAYAGERITSVRALEDAIELGLVEEPAPAEQYVDRPVAPASAALPWDGDREPQATEPVYYRGHVAAQFRIGGEQEHSFMIGMGPIATPNAYVLRRQSDAAPLDEAQWKADLDGDGDQDDSNLVFAIDAAAPAVAALWKAVDVTVPDDYAWGACRAESDLFDKQPAGLQARPSTVLGSRPSDQLRHLVLVEAGDE